MIKLLIHGINGRMGRILTGLAEDDCELQIVGGVDVTEGTCPYPVARDFSDPNIPLSSVICDFSTASAVPALLSYAIKNKIPVVLCTTALSKETQELVSAAANEIPIFMSANMSLGANVLISLAQKAADILSPAGFDIEIIESHHNQKLDAPSGTAHMIAEGITERLVAGGSENTEPEYVFARADRIEKRAHNEIGIHSIRGGTIFGEHTVLYAGNNELIEIKHSAMSREIFAAGAIAAVKFLAGKQPGIYGMKDIIEV